MNRVGAGGGMHDRRRFLQQVEDKAGWHGARGRKPQRDPESNTPADEGWREEGFGVRKEELLQLTPRTHLHRQPVGLAIGRRLVCAGMRNSCGSVWPDPPDGSSSFTIFSARGCF